MKITEQVTGFARPVVESLGCRLWDVEYVREGADWFLRIYIDKDGGVDITDCDPIPASYHFEVCSAGLERVLKRPGDFQQFLHSPVLVKLYRPRDGAKEYPGTLEGYDNGRVTIATGSVSLTFEKSEIAQVRLRVEF